MTMTCPLCKASNDAGPACRRCRADLALLFAVEACREAELAAARSALAQGRPEVALNQALRADDLRHGADAARVAAAAALLARDFATAWKQYQRSRSLNGG